VLPAAQLVYLEKKKKQAEAETHKVEAGETLWDISQAYGVKLAVLQSANDMDASDKLTAGSTIKLQAPAGKGLPQIRLPRR
jgi:membrane-bound lytic murein transglycosylase D